VVTIQNRGVVTTQMLAARLTETEVQTLKLIDMKKLLIISVFWGLVLSSYSQLNYFLPDSNSYFSVSPYKFWFQGDTIIRNKKYKKVFQQNGDSIADFNKATYYAAVREDTLSEKIYCIQKDDGVERLISDFSLNAGDTVSVYSFWPFGTPEKRIIKVKNVDSIQINNQYRKRINIDIENNNYIESWIEGIGSTFGLFFPSAYGFADLGLPELICIHINNIIVFQNPYYNDCFKDLLVGIIEKNHFFFKIYPTITKDYLIIESDLNSGGSFHYNIFNNQGIELKSGIITTNYIDVSLLKTGLYFITIYTKKGKAKFYIQKFIKS